MGKKYNHSDLYANTASERTAWVHVRRRSLLLKTGGFVLAGAGLFGSGAFTTSSTTRDVSVEVTGDAAANLRLYSGSGDHGNLVTEGADGVVTIDVRTVDNGTATPGSGVNEGTVTALDNVLGIENGGPNTVTVSASFPSGSGIVLFRTYAGPGSIDGLDEPGNGISLDPDKSTEVGLAIDAGYGTPEISGTFANDDTVTVTIEANAI